MDPETIVCISAPLKYFISEISCPTIFTLRLLDLVWTWMEAETSCQVFFVEIEEVSMSPILAVIQVLIPGPHISLSMRPTQATSRCLLWQIFAQWAVWGLCCWWAAQKHSLQLSFGWKLCSSAPKQLASLVHHSCGTTIGTSEFCRQKAKQIVENERQRCRTSVCLSEPTGSRTEGGRDGRPAEKLIVFTKNNQKYLCFLGCLYKHCHNLQRCKLAVQNLLSEKFSGSF